MSRWGAMWNLWLDGPQATRPWSSAREDEGGGSWPAAESGAWGLTWHRGEAWGWPWGCGGACLPLGPSTGGDKDHCVPGGGAGPVPGLRQDSGPSCLQCRLVKQSTRGAEGLQGGGVSALGHPGPFCWPTSSTLGRSGPSTEMPPLRARVPSPTETHTATWVPACLPLPPPPGHGTPGLWAPLGSGPGLCQGPGSGLLLSPRLFHG